MFLNSLNILEKIVQSKQDEIERELARNSLFQEGSQAAKGGKKAGWKYRLLIAVGVLSGLAWFFH